MNKYTVTITLSGSIQYTVEADREFTAEKEAVNLLWKEFDASSGLEIDEIDVEEVEE